MYENTTCSNVDEIIAEYENNGWEIYGYSNYPSTGGGKPRTVELRRRKI